MGISVILAVGGGFLVTSAIIMALDKVGKPEQSRTLELVAVLAGMTVAVTMLGTLISKVQTVFNLF